MFNLALFYVPSDDTPAPDVANLTSLLDLNAMSGGFFRKYLTDGASTEFGFVQLVGTGSGSLFPQPAAPLPLIRFASRLYPSVGTAEPYNTGWPTIGFYPSLMPMPTGSDVEVENGIPFFNGNVAEANLTSSGSIIAFAQESYSVIAVIRVRTIGEHNKTSDPEDGDVVVGDQYSQFGLRVRGNGSELLVAGIHASGGIHAVHGAIIPGQTHLVILTYDEPTGILRLQVDGGFVDTLGPINPVDDTDGTFAIGWDPSNGFYFSGEILDVSIWQEALTPTMVDAVRPHYEAIRDSFPSLIPPPTYAVTPTAWWSCGLNPYCRDSVPYTTLWEDMMRVRQLTANGSPVPANGVAVFDGTDDFYSSASAVTTIASVSAYTVIVVFRAHAINTTSGNYFQNDAIITEISDGNWALALRDVAGTYYLGGYHWDTGHKVAVQEIQLDTWHIAVWRFDGSAISLNVDGSQSITGAGNVLDLGGGIRVGRSYGSEYFDGEIAELFCLDAYLSDAGVDDVMPYFEDIRDRLNAL